MPELHTPRQYPRRREPGEECHLARQRLDRDFAKTRRQDAVRLLGLKPDRIAGNLSRGPRRLFRRAAQRRPSRPVRSISWARLSPARTSTRCWMPGRARACDAISIWWSPGPAAGRQKKRMARLASRPPGVRYLGYVPEDELPGLTAGATAFVYPSLYEGFGIPVAQAMAAGVPVITSNTSWLPEIAGDGALLVDPAVRPRSARLWKSYLRPPRCARNSARGAENAPNNTAGKSAPARASSFFGGWDSTPHANPD